MAKLRAEGLSDDLEHGLAPLHQYYPDHPLAFMFIDRFMKKHVAASAVREFVEGGHRVPYGHRLNVLLPFIASVMRAPAIPAKIASNLKKLKNYRNDIAHQGKPRDKLDRQAVSDLLAAVALGVVYVNLLENTAFPPDDAPAP